MIHRFGDFELDDEQCLLRRSGEPVAIQPKAFDVLLYLIRARSRVVPKTELLDRLWPDTVVGEHSVVRAVNTLRSALGDTRSPRSYVRNVARRGYRFVAELEQVGGGASAAPSSPDAGAVRETPQRGACPSPEDVFVGRDELLASLDLEIGLAFAGSARTLILEGDAGIGKTRSAARAAELARARGAEVYGGWCPENEAAAPFQPWLQILGAVTRSPSWRRIRRTHPVAAADVEALLRGSPPSLDADTAPADTRFRIFEAVTAVVGAVAERVPLLLVIDDLHAADVSSLRLVEFLTREIREAPVVLLLALRSEEVDLAHPVVPTLAELARRRTQRFRLEGLTRDEVGRCVEAWSAAPPDSDFVDELFRRSEGNPFFVRELARWLLADAKTGPGERTRVPPSVRDVIRRRLRPCSRACIELLELAAVLGRSFDLELLIASAALPRERVLASLEEAAALRLIEEDPDASRWRLAHGLIQDCLLEDRTSLGRARTHRRIAAALSTLDGDPDVRLAALAHHACEGADAATAEQAVACALRAGERAMALTAFEEASRLYGRALHALELSPARTPERRCALLLDLARAQAHAGEATDAEGSYAEAQRLASELRDARLSVRSAIGLLGGLPAIAPPPVDRIRALERASEGLAPEDAPLRLRALSRIGLAWSAAGDRARGRRHADTALREARRLGDPRGLAGALWLRAAVFDPLEPPAARVARLDEALRSLAEAPSTRIELECRIHRNAALLELGRTDTLESEMTAYAALAVRLNQRTPRWLAAVQVALRRLMSGDLAAAERDVLAAHAAGRRAGHPDANSYLAIQLTQLRYFQGRLAEMEDPLRRAVEGAPWLVGLRAALALVLAESGRPKETRRELDALARDDFAGIPRDAGWLSNLSLLALVAARLRDPDHAAALEALLEPLRERTVCAFVVASNGSVRHFLGILAAARGDASRGMAGLEQAVAENRRMGIAPWTASSEQALADLLLERGEPESLLRAAELAASALAGAERMGMAPLAAAARRTVHAVEARLAGSTPARRRRRAARASVTGR